MDIKDSIEHILDKHGILPGNGLLDEITDLFDVKLKMYRDMISIACEEYRQHTEQIDSYRKINKLLVEENLELLKELDR